MVIINILMLSLVGVGLSALYLALWVLATVQNKKWLSSLPVPIFILGFFDFINGMYLSYTWPMPSTYNLLFGNPLMLFGTLMLAGGYMLYKGTNPKILSLFGFFLGIFLIIESAAMYNYKLESGQYLPPAFGLFLFSGISGLLAPVVYADSKGSGKYLYYILFIFLILTMLAAFFVGYMAIYSHLNPAGA
ncbi:MAG: DUF981 family protein [Candidatus Micrarchaeia archaeon]